MPSQIKSRKGLLNAFEAAPGEIRDYFKHLKGLLDAYPMDVSLAYTFSRLELGQNMALYCGAVKLYRADIDVAKAAVNTHHMTRKGFEDLYQSVFGFKLPAAALSDLKNAETARDSIMHGKSASEDHIRNAIASALMYAQAVNKQLHSKHKLKPFGSLKGFAGRGWKHDARTTRLVLKGLGFSLS